MERSKSAGLDTITGYYTNLTKKQQECKYCHETSGLKERLLGDGFIYDTGYHKLEFFDLDKPEKYSVKIYYCPMCGRELNKGDK